MSLTRRVFLERIAQIGGYSAAFRTMQVLGLTVAEALPPFHHWVQTSEKARA